MSYGNTRGAAAGQPRRDNQAAANELAGQGLTYAQQNMYTTSEADRELWRILVDVPKLTNSTPYFVAIVNVALPGIGTMAASCLANPNNWSKTQLMCGLLQMLTAVFVIGWIWSLYWAYLFIARARQDA